MCTEWTANDELETGGASSVMSLFNYVLVVFIFVI